MKNNKSISSRLADMIAFLKECEKDCLYYREQQSQAERKQNDLLHFIELDGTGYKERCKLMTQLRGTLLERRYYKDQVELRAPIAEYLTDPQNKKLYDQLASILGACRKAEKYHANRTYSPRVLNRSRTPAENTDYRLSK